MVTTKKLAVVLCKSSKNATEIRHEFRDLAGMPSASLRAIEFARQQTALGVHCTVIEDTERVAS